MNKPVTTPSALIDRAKKIGQMKMTSLFCSSRGSSWVLALALILPLFPCSYSFAADGSSGPGHFDFRKKAENKEGTRWTLQEWLAQKERNQIMDLWLAMYAPSPYEFYLSGWQNSYNLETSVGGASAAKQNYSTYAGSFGAFATVVGIEVQQENNSSEKINDLNGLLQLRVAGNAVQGTHLILQYGLRTRYQDVSGVNTRINQSFLGLDLNLYFNRYVGISGNYRTFIPQEHETLGSLSGSRSEAGIFIDFAAFRVFGSWYSEKNLQNFNSTETSNIRSGSLAGFKFFF